MKSAIKLVRRILDVALILLVVAVLGLVLAVRVGPGLGHDLIVIRGGSMEPGVPLGSVVDVTRVQPSDLRVGDIVTFKQSNGVTVTHRIVALKTVDDALYIHTKGDANADPDPVLVPVTTVSGRVAVIAPYLGYLVYLLTIPSGIASIFCLAITLLLAIWLLEDLEEDEEDEQEEQEVSVEDFPSWADEPPVEQARRGARLRRLMPFRSSARARAAATDDATGTTQNPVGAPE